MIRLFTFPVRKQNYGQKSITVRARKTNKRKTLYIKNFTGRDKVERG